MIDARRERDASVRLPLTSREGTLMHATLARIKEQPGQTAEVARLIEAEYLPQIEGVEGFVSYTLVDLGDDEISSAGIHRRGERPTRERHRPELDGGEAGTLRGLTAGRPRRVGAHRPPLKDPPRAAGRHQHRPPRAGGGGQLA